MSGGSGIGSIFRPASYEILKDELMMEWNNDTQRIEFIKRPSPTYPSDNIDVYIQGSIQAEKLLKLTANTTVIECDETNIGSIIFSNDNKHYGCDGTNWNALY